MVYHKNQRCGGERDRKWLISGHVYCWIVSTKLESYRNCSAQLYLTDPLRLTDSLTDPNDFFFFLWMGKGP